LGALASGAAALLGGCNPFGSTYSYRYKITVEVDTPEGIKTGFAVHEIAASENAIKLVDGDQAWVSFRGEAFPVDLGERKTLFVLVASSDPTEESLIPAVQSALDPDYKRGGMGNLATVKKIAGSWNTQRAVLKPTNRFEGGDRSFYPLLVRFRDESDPKTVEEVKPENFQSMFGAGYRLNEITVETTNDDLTDDIVKRLKWLLNKPEGGSYSGPFRSPETRPTEYLDGLGQADFWRGK
jgi:hypothetical protein